VLPTAARRCGSAATPRRKAKVRPASERNLGRNQEVLVGLCG
jgi:hypothetical protein